MALKVLKFGLTDPGTIIDEYLFVVKHSFGMGTEGKENEEKRGL